MKLLKLLKKIFSLNESLSNDDLNYCKDALYFIYGSEALPMPLTQEEEDGYLKDLSSNNREIAISKLIEHNLRLVIYIAKKYENSGVDNEDLISIGAIGLVKAVKSFDNSKNIKLATYASRCIENEILMHLRKVIKQKGEVSLDEPLNVDYDGNELLLSDILSTEFDTVGQKIEIDEEKKLLYQAINHLNSTEQQIMRLRFGLFGQTEMTQKEVADILGISQSYISRLEKKIFSRLKKDLTKFN